MRRLLHAARLAAALLVLMLPPAVAAAQEAAVPPSAPDAPWQDVITGQIEAFRHHDAPAAFSYAGASFHRQFASAGLFFRIIMGTGYAPIMLSKAHSFGGFQAKDSKDVLQVVKFIGPNQELYEAVYAVTLEDTGWRVQGVVLSGPKGVGI